jgi:hypothetical protein
MHCQENKNPHIFIISFRKKTASAEQCQNGGSVFEGCIKNMFYCEKNSSKLCAEGAIGNLMNIFHCLKNDMELFWDIVCALDSTTIG